MSEDLDKYYWRKIKGKWVRLEKKLVLKKGNGFSYATYEIPKPVYMKKETSKIKKTKLSPAIAAHNTVINSTPKKESDIEIYIDGSCLDNNQFGIGGYGVIVIEDGNIIFQETGGSSSTTNNRMELYAFLKALKYIENKDCNSIGVFSDSKYVVDSLNKGWLNNWISKNELDKRPNNDLWKEINSMLPQLKDKYTLSWIKAHDTSNENNAVDKLALSAAKYQKSQNE